MERITQALAASQTATSTSNQLGSFLETVVLVLFIGGGLAALVFGGARLLAGRIDLRVTHGGTVHHEHTVSGEVTYRHVGEVQHVGTVNHVVQLDQGDRDRLDRLAISESTWPASDAMLTARPVADGVLLRPVHPERATVDYVRRTTPEIER